MVSEKHTNFLINTGNATAADIEGLGEEVRRRVHDRSSASCSNGRSAASAEPAPAGVDGEGADAREADDASRGAPRAASRRRRLLRQLRRCVRRGGMAAARGRGCGAMAASSLSRMPAGQPALVAAGRRIARGDRRARACRQRYRGRRPRDHRHGDDHGRARRRRAAPRSWRSAPAAREAAARKPALGALGRRSSGACPARFSSASSSASRSRSGSTTASRS